MRARGSDEGVATVWAAGAIVALLVVVVAWLQLGAVLVVRHRAESAVDLAALAAAGRAVVGERLACDRARQITDRARVRLVSCRLAGWDALVVVAADVGGPLRGAGTVTARARAGPVQEIGQ